jgi:hypothetical protein
LWKKKAVDMYFHIHMAAVSAWSYVPHVEKNSHTTPHQALKNNAKQKSKMPLSQSCSALQTAAPT